MRTTIEIDEKLMAEALRVTGLKNKRDVVRVGLRMLQTLELQKKLRELRGKIQWQGDLDEMRRD